MAFVAGNFLFLNLIHKIPKPFVSWSDFLNPIVKKDPFSHSYCLLVIDPVTSSSKCLIGC